MWHLAVGGRWLFHGPGALLEVVRDVLVHLRTAEARKSSRALGRHCTSGARVELDPVHLRTMMDGWLNMPADCLTESRPQTKLYMGDFQRRSIVLNKDSLTHSLHTTTAMTSGVQKQQETRSTRRLHEQHIGMPGRNTISRSPYVRTIRTSALSVKDYPPVLRGDL